MSSYFHILGTNHSIKRFLLQILLVHLMSSLTMHIWILLYPHITNIPPVNMKLTGRWFHMIAHGKFFTTSIAGEPSIIYEFWIGKSLSQIIGLFFSTLFVSLCHCFRITPRFWTGLLFGLIMTVCPLFIQLPSMGSGVMGFALAHPQIVWLRIFSVHTAYAIGMGCGVVIFNNRNRILRRNNKIISSSKSTVL